MQVQKQSLIIFAIWAVLVGEILFSAVTARWSMVFVASLTLFISILPLLFAGRFHIFLPMGFLIWIVIFTFSTIYLGEAFGFYERYWWWDILLHGGSAIGFGLIGFIFVFILFQGDRYAAPPWAMGFMAFCLAVAIGTTWEIFEFGMDQVFGMNMQKSGLVDTMSDLIVDMLGASVGAFSGFLYVKGRSAGGLTSLIDEFVSHNRRLFRKISRKPPSD